MNDAKFTEIELKFNAKDISLVKFTEFCKSRNPEKFIFASGYDYFYDNQKDQDAFCRYRTGPDSNQLTFKRKTTDTNNFIRTEHNIDLGADVNKEQIEALVSEFGYKHNTSLFKVCFVYRYDWYILVYYIVYDIEMQELGRFVEIEAREDYNWKTKQEAWDSIVVIEKMGKSIGLNPQARMRRSLFEMYKNG